MRYIKPSIKSAIASTLVLTSTAIGVYAIDNAIDSKSQDIGNKLKLDVEKIDRDTVKVSLDNVKDIPKAIQFSIKLDGNVSLKNGQDSIVDLVRAESEKKVKNTLSQEVSNIITDYTYNEKDNTIDVLITSDNYLPKSGNRIDVFTLDIKSTQTTKGSAPTYKVVPVDTQDYKYISSTNKEYNNLGVTYDEELVISMNTPPIITKNDSYIQLEEDEILELTSEKLGITMTDEDGDTLTLQIKDKSSNKVITEFKKSTPGVYELECVAIDSYGEKSEAISVFVDVSLSDIDTPPTITRNNEKLQDITINGGDIFNPSENVKAVDAKGRDVKVNLSIDKELNLDPDEDTTYTLTYTATDIYKNTATEVVKLTVNANKPPVIKGVKDHVITVGDSFDPKAGVSVEDEDNNIELKVESNVNTSVAGTYKVLYTATDSKGKTTRAQSKVTVNAKSSIVNSIPVITASDKTIKVGETFTDEDALKDVTAYDEEDKDLTKDIKVVENNVNTAKEGKYKVTYSVEDSQGAKATKTITVTVKKDIILVESVTINNKIDKIFVGGDKVLTASVSENAYIKDLEWTTSDSNIVSIEVVGNDAILVAKSTGTVTIAVKAVDGSNKSDSITIEVMNFEDDKTISTNIKDVIDTNVVLPISGTGDIDNPIELKVKAVKTDKFNKFVNSLKELSATIVSKHEEDNYTVYKLKLTQKKKVLIFNSFTDSYITIKVDNNLENAQEMKNILNNISNQAPEIFIDGLKTTINVGDKFDKLEGVSAIDFEDGNITDKIVVIGDVDTSKAGEYELTYEVTDKNGSKTSLTVVIKVVEKQVSEPEKPSSPTNTLPVISITSNINKLYVGDSFNALDGVKANDKEDGDLTKHITVSGNVDTSKPGKYTIIYTVIDSDLNEVSLTRIIEVVERPNEDTISPNTPNTNTPSTGDVGILGFVGLSGLALGGLLLNKKIKNK